MRKRIHWKPETIDSVSWRVQVIGGWIVGHNQMNGMVFVPDKDHEWKIIDPQEKQQNDLKETSSISEGY